MICTFKESLTKLVRGLIILYLYKMILSLKLICSPQSRINALGKSSPLKVKMRHLRLRPVCCVVREVGKREI